MMMQELTNPDLSLLFRLVLAHLTADFMLQRKTWVEEKNAKHWKAKSLYVHVAIAGILTYLFSGHYTNYWIPLLVTFTHYITDLAKTYTGNSLKFFIADQIAHLIIIIVAWYLYLTPGIDLIETTGSYLANEKFWAVITGYIFILRPSGFLIAKITENWQEQISNDGLKDAGKWIGMFERMLILTFVLIGQFSGIGFLIAAKSILRFGDIKNADNRKDAEYILLGTMISFLIAIFTGLLIENIG
jgi:hypothetical protein